MRRIISVFFILLFILINAGNYGHTAPMPPEPIQPSLNDQFDPAVSSLGEVVWAEYINGNSQVFSSTRGQLTSDSTSKVSPSVNSLGDVIWQESVWNGSQNTYSIKGIISGQPRVLFVSSNPVGVGNLNDSGEFVYTQIVSGFSQVFSNSRGQLTFDATSHDSPAIANNSDIVWRQYDNATASNKVLRLAAGTATPVLITSTPDWINGIALNNVEVVWNQHNGSVERLYSSVRGQLTFAAPAGNHSMPAINSCGDVVFTAMGTPPAQVYRLGTASPCSGAPEPNDTPVQATATTLGSSLTGVIDSGANPEDWYRFEAMAGDSIHILANDNQLPHIITLGLYNGAMNLLATPTVTNGVITISHTAAYSGTYYLRVQSSGGRAGYAVRIEKTTPPPGVPTADTGPATSITAVDAVLNATVNTNFDQTSVAFNFGLDTNYGSTLAALQSPLTASAGNSPVSVAVTGLNCNTTYHYRVIASNSAGAVAGLDNTFTTAVCPILPPVVTTGPATAVSTTAVTLNALAGANGGATAVIFEYGLTTGYGTNITASESPLDINTWRSVTAKAAGLACGTTYHFRVSGSNSAGTTNGQDASFTTTACPPFGNSIINTVAGNGLAAYAGDSSAGTSTSLHYPYGVATDSVGNVYIADTFNYRIRKLTTGSSIITTVTGNGSYGSAGDGGAATSAQLSAPYGIAVDKYDNIYIADTYNNLIRKIDAQTGTINTIAGLGYFNGGYNGDGIAATSAKINWPKGIAVDSTGNVFFADYNNHRIRRIDSVTGQITTVAGNGTGTFAGDNGPATSASLNWPTGVALDTAGNFFIADSLNMRIRRVDAVSGNITTVAGKSATGLITYTGEGGPATSATLPNINGPIVDGVGNIFLTSNNRVLKVSAATGIITTVAGNDAADYYGDGGLPTGAGLHAPAGLTLDNAGNMYIADTYNHMIRKVTKQGVTTASIAYSPQGPYKTGDQVTMLITFNDLVVDTPVPKILLSGANILAPTPMTKVDYRHYSYIHKVTAGSGTITVSIPSGSDINGLPVSASPASGATFLVNAIAEAPDWVGAQLANAGQDIKVWWPASATAGATYTIFANGIQEQTDVTGTVAILTGLANGSYSVTVRADLASWISSTPKAAASPVVIAKTVAAPDWVGAQLANTGQDIKVWWPASATAGATYTVFANGIQQQTGVTGTVAILTGLANGSYSVTVKSDLAGWISSTPKTAASPVVIAKTVAAPVWVGAQLVNAGQDIKVWWPASTTAGATYTVFANGIQQQTGVTGTVAILAGLANGSYSVTVRADLAGWISSTPKAAASPVVISKTAPSPAWLGVSKNGNNVKLWWPTSSLTGAGYRITETRNGAANATPITGPFLTSGALSYIILTGKTAGTYSYTIRTTVPGYNDSAPTAGSASVTIQP